MISEPPKPDLKNQTRKPIANTTPSINGASNVCVLPPTSYSTELIHYCGPFPQRNVDWRQQTEQPLPNPHLVAGPLSSATPVILSTLWWGRGGSVVPLFLEPVSIFVNGRALTKQPPKG